MVLTNPGGGCESGLSRTLCNRRGPDAHTHQMKAIECASGGPSVQWVDHALGLIYALALVCTFDVVVARRIFPTQGSARWFLVHAAFNLCVVVTSFRDVVSVVVSPLCSMWSNMGSWLPAYFTISGVLRLHRRHPRADSTRAAPRRLRFPYATLLIPLCNARDGVRSRLPRAGVQPEAQ